MCDFSYPHAFIYQGTCLEIKAKDVKKSMEDDDDSKAKTSSGIDLVDDFKLVEVNLNESEFK